METEHRPPAINKCAQGHIIDALDDIRLGLDAILFLSSQTTLDNGLKVVLDCVATHFDLAAASLKNAHDEMGEKHEH